MYRALIGLLAMLAIIPVERQADAAGTYTVGVDAAVTGVLASSYGPVKDGMRLYLDAVNKAGGISGAPVQLVIRDDQSEASRGAANAKRLADQDDVLLLVNLSGSQTYQPTMATAKRAGIPLLFLGACPTEVYPPAQPLMFCTNAFASHYDSHGALDFIKDAAGTSNVALGLMSQTLPIARAEIDFAEVLGKQMGMRPVDKEIIPLATADFTPYATKLAAANPDWIWSWSGWELQTGVLQAMRRLGWKGNYLGWSHVQAEDDLPRFKDPHWYTIGTNAYFLENLPVQKEIAAAAKAAGITYAASRLEEGWVAGMAIEAALHAAAAKGPVTRASLAGAMNTLTVDTKGLRGGPIVWTQTNHFRTRQSYRVYHWNGTSLEAVGGWRGYDVK